MVPLSVTVVANKHEHACRRYEQGETIPICELNPEDERIGFDNGSAAEDHHNQDCRGPNQCSSFVLEAFVLFKLLKNCVGFHSSALQIISTDNHNITSVVGLAHWPRSSHSPPLAPPGTIQTHQPARRAAL